MIRLEDHVNFHGPDWNAIKIFLEQVKEVKIGLLVQAVEHDESNKIRGALSLIQQLLAYDKAANTGR